MRQATTLVCATGDDNLAPLVRMALAGTGITLLQATTPAQALALVDTHHPDLLLLDVALTDAAGQGLLAALRATSSVPVIIVSAQQQDVLAFCGPGAGRFLVTRPCSVQMLLARLKALAGHPW